MSNHMVNFNIPRNEKGSKFINPLALQLNIYGLGHHLCKMRIFYEPRSVTLGNFKTFCGGINKDGERKSKKNY